MKFLTSITTLMYDTTCRLYPVGIFWEVDRLVDSIASVVTDIIHFFDQNIALITT